MSSERQGLPEEAVRAQNAERAAALHTADDFEKALAKYRRDAWANEGNPIDGLSPESEQRVLEEVLADQAKLLEIYAKSGKCDKPACIALYEKAKALRESQQVSDQAYMKALSVLEPLI